MDFAAIIDGGSDLDLVEAGNTTVTTTSTNHYCLRLRLALTANSGSDTTAVNSSPCNTVSSYSRFFVANFTINAVKYYGKAGPNELNSV